MIQISSTAIFVIFMTIILSELIGASLFFTYLGIRDKDRIGFILALPFALATALFLLVLSGQIVLV